MGNKTIRDVAAKIKQTGVIVTAVKLTGSGHIQFRISHPVTQARGVVVCSATPRVAGAYRNILRDVRAALRSEVAL